MAAYVLGFMVMLMLLGWHPQPELRPKHGPPGGGIEQVHIKLDATGAFIANRWWGAIAGGAEEQE